jgi:hypothetical protein
MLDAWAVFAPAEHLRRIARHFRRRITCWIRRWLGQWLRRFKGRIAKWIMHRLVGRITFGGSDWIVERLQGALFAGAPATRLTVTNVM